MKLILFFSLCFPFTLLAQSNELDQFYQSNYQPSELNIAFTTRFDSIYTAYRAKKNVTDDKNDALKEFVLNYNYFLDKLNKSGEIFYNDEISKYLNELKDTLLFDHPEKNNIRIYLTNFNELNAFTNDFGNVYVNIGLIAKMNSADELLTVLAHEIAHVLLEHSYKQENRNLDLENGRQVNKVDEIEVFESHKFSQKQELEADSMAYLMIVKGGFNVSAFESSFESLRHSKNPISSAYTNLNRLFFGNLESISYFEGIRDTIELQDLNFELDSAELAALRDSFPMTHPTIDQRIEYIQQFLDSNAVYASYPGRKDFQSIKLLASKVYLKKLADEGNYIEGLFLASQLREAAPNDPFLIKMQLKQMLLLTQSKYQPRYTNQVLNEHGNECDNENYLRFRWAVLQVPALEMNIMTILAIKNAKSDDPYLKRLAMLADQFLYKNNRFLFKTEANGIAVRSDIDLEKRRSDDLTLYFTSDEKSEQKKRKEFGYEYIHTLVSSETLIMDFLNNGLNNASFSQHVAQYKSRRDEFNQNLALGQFSLTIRPRDFKKMNPKGDFTPSLAYSKTSKSALAQSDTYSIIFDRNGADIDVLQTADYNETISTVLKEKGLFERFYTNQVNSKPNITVKENYTHYALNKYMDDCWELSDLVYSSVDEEVQSIISEENLDYVSYNLNMIIRDKTVNKTFSVHYTIYFDLDNMGVTCFVKIPNRNRPTEPMIRRIFSASNYNKNE